MRRNSVTEFTPLLMLNEKLSVECKIISNSKITPEGNGPLLIKHELSLENIDYSSSTPTRFSYKNAQSGDFKALEKYVFNRWNSFHYGNFFEWNKDSWRQFWITCERASTIARIIDARNPSKYFNEDILSFLPEIKSFITYY